MVFNPMEWKNNNLENELPRGLPRGIEAPPRLRRARPGIATPKNGAASRGVFIIPRKRDKLDLATIIRKSPLRGVGLGVEQISHSKCKKDTLIKNILHRGNAAIPIDLGKVVGEKLKLIQRHRFKNYFAVRCPTKIK